MLKLFKKLTKKQWLMLFGGLALVVLQVWAEITLIDYMKEVTGLVTMGGTVKDIVIAGVKMLALSLASIACAISVGLIASVVAAGFSATLRGQLFNKVQSFSMQEINEFSTASLITRSTNDINQVQMLIAMGMQLVLRAPIMAIWAFSKIVGRNWQWSTAVGVAVIVIFAMIAVILVFAHPKFKKIQTLTDDINDSMREQLTGLRVVRAYNAEGFQEAKFEKANNALAKNNLAAHRIMSAMMPVMGGVMSGLSLAIYWIGMYVINKASMPEKMGLYSEMVVFSSYGMQIVMSFMMMSFIFIMLPRARVAGKRINEVLSTENAIIDGTLSEGEQGKYGEVVFDDVSFAYPDAECPVIEHISFSAKKGETVALIGSTGSGKSTVINLIPRFFDVTEGAVYVDGVNVKDYVQSELVKKIGYVSQRSVLFSGDVASNVVYGSEGRENENAEIKEALDTSFSTEFVQEKEDKEHSFVARGGTNFSGGQKQRLSIARAMYRKPEILIFDDSFSALDYKTDKGLRSALKDKLSGTTVLIVAQRIGTIMDADKIIVLDDGKIVGAGTHKELLKNCKVYREIAESQLSKEELDYAE